MLSKSGPRISDTTVPFLSCDLRFASFLPKKEKNQSQNINKLMKNKEKRNHMKVEEKRNNHEVERPVSNLNGSYLWV